METLNSRQMTATGLMAWMIRLGLGATFIWASWHKILAPDQFAMILYGYGIFPGNTINLLAMGVPFVELIAGICLISGVYRRPALILINAMLLGFVLIIGFNLVRGHTFDCGCFSFGQAGNTASAVGLLVRDILMLGAGLLLWRRFTQEGA